MFPDRPLNCGWSRRPDSQRGDARQFEFVARLYRFPVAFLQRGPVQPCRVVPEVDEVVPLRLAVEPDVFAVDSDRLVLRPPGV